MTRPLALIEGALALPSSRSLSGLPPPFGSWRRSASHTQAREPHSAMPGAPGYAPTAGPRVRIPPNTRFLFFYKLPQRPSSDGRFDEQLAEARRYLEADDPRPHSSRSDRILGAAIFVGCSIALAWLLATCSTHEITGNDTVAARPSPAVVRADPVTAEPAKSVVNVTQASREADPAASPATNRWQKIEHRVGTVSSSQQVKREANANAGPPRQLAGGNRLTSIHRPLAVERFNHVPIERGQAALNHLVHPQTPLAAHGPHQETASRFSLDDSAERAALSDWAAQQRHASITTTTRPTPSASAPASDNIDWNAHMTQRRITDNPAAFQSGPASLGSH